MKYNPSTKEAHKLVHEGLLSLSRASQYGMCIDVDYCIRTNERLGKKIKRYEKKFLKTDTGKIWTSCFSNPNLNSPDQIKEVLFNKMQLECPKKTAKGNESVDNEVLEIMTDTHPEIALLNKLRKYKKVQGTYIQGYLKEQVNGIMHPNFNLHTTVSYRSSADSPNQQNNPKRDPEQKKLCREAIIPRKGNQIIAADVEGIEVATAECYHLDPVMKKYIEDEKTDMHKDMAVQIFMLDSFKKEGAEKVLRNAAKNSFVFPQFYGDYYGNNAQGLAKWGTLPRSGKFNKKDGLELMTDITLGEHLISKGIKNYNSFEKHIQRVEKDFWKKRFKVYAKWKEDWYKKYVNTGYMWTKTGFTIHGLLSKNQIINLPVQGSAFHILLKMLNEVDRISIRDKWKTRCIGQIHDEMIFDAPPDERNMLLETIEYVATEWLPEQWKWINIPIKMEVDVFPVDGSWAEEPQTLKIG